MVSWGGLPAGLQEEEWAVLSGAVWHWLLPCPPGHSAPSSFPSSNPLLFYMEIARASLCVRACVRLYIRV